MLQWSSLMLHPDKEISFFNDAAFGIAPTSQKLIDYAERLSIEVQMVEERFKHMKNSGYCRLSDGPAVVIADVGKVGPDYLPGHAHADTLSFEASLFGERVIVNSGTSVYGSSPERLRQRGTAAHSTVLIGGHNSSEVWSGFRVARRVQNIELGYNINENRLNLTASHDGYHRLRTGLNHKRSWELDPLRLSIFDEVMDQYPSYAIFHLHPNVRVTQESKKSGLLKLSNNKYISWNAEQGTSVVNGTWHPEFGKSVQNSCLRLPLINGKSKITFEWS